mmetsp:Transcript_56080/g.88880  ORF Transcript_56080/g.88880 Transcript_56080/m.88880 type:complete len:355 (-) Transcript_56080:204-1268(-)
MQLRSRPSTGQDRSEGARRYFEEVVGRFWPSRRNAGSVQHSSFFGRAGSAPSSSAVPPTSLTGSSGSSRTFDSSAPSRARPTTSSQRLNGDEDEVLSEGMNEEGSANDRVGDEVCQERPPNRGVRIMRLSRRRQHNEDEEEVHPMVTCDGCGSGPPLRGRVFKCAQCDDFDFCERCFRNRSQHDHPAEHTFNARRPPNNAGTTSATTGTSARARARAAVAAAMGGGSNQAEGNRSAFALLQFLEDEMLQEAMRRSMETESNETKSQQAEAKAKAVLSAIPRIKFGEPADSSSESTAQQKAAEANCDECPMCLDEFTQGEEVLRLPCDHLFHESCLGPWLLKSLQCPMCMRDLSA